MDPAAEWWRRLLGQVVDYVILSVVGGAIGFAIGGRASVSDEGRRLRLELPFWLLYFFYDWIGHAWFGQTIGKRLFRTKVVMVDGGPVGWGASAIRSAVFNLVPLLPCIGFPIFWLLNPLWLLWDRPYRQCLHDKAAGTRVINVDAVAPAPYGAPPGHVQS